MNTTDRILDMAIFYSVFLLSGDDLHFFPSSSSPPHRHSLAIVVTKTVPALQGLICWYFYMLVFLMSFQDFYACVCVNHLGVCLWEDSYRVVRSVLFRRVMVGWGVTVN